MSRKWAIILVLIWMFVGAHGQQLGDLYTFPDGSQGVVYYLLPDGSGGWVVASILYIIAGAIAVCPAVVDFVSKK